jgi:hypothetical protein
MNPIDNYKLIEPHLRWDNSDMFYFIQIFKRRKDNPGMDKDMVLIDNFYIYTKEQFDKIYPLIKTTCNAHNARAYFRFNRRSAKQTALQSLKRLTEMIIQENYKSAKGSYASAAGEFHAEKDKTWIIDVDDIDLKDLSDREKIKDILIDLQIKTGREPLILEFPSRNGIHYITRAFNSKEYEMIIKEMDIRTDLHKDNPTILYMP